MAKPKLAEVKIPKNREEAFVRVPLSTLRAKAKSVDLTPQGLVTLVLYCQFLGSHESDRAGHTAMRLVLDTVKKNPALPLLLLERPQLREVLDKMAGEVAFAKATAKKKRK